MNSNLFSNFFFCSRYRSYGWNYVAFWVQINYTGATSSSRLCVTVKIIIKENKKKKNVEKKFRKSLPENQTPPDNSIIPNTLYKRPFGRYYIFVAVRRPITKVTYAIMVPTVYAYDTPRACPSGEFAVRGTENHNVQKCVFGEGRTAKEAVVVPPTTIFIFTFDWITNSTFTSTIHVGKAETLR